MGNNLQTRPIKLLYQKTTTKSIHCHPSKSLNQKKAEKTLKIHHFDQLQHHQLQ